MMNISRSLYWKLNWYRQSELEGALLLGKAVRAAENPRLIAAMTKHAADEAGHAQLWAETIAQIGCPWVRILRSYQSYYGQFGIMPATLTEVLALTHVFERRVWRQFRQELDQCQLPVPVQSTIKRLLDDERQHLEWVREFLSSAADAEPLLPRYTEVDRQVYEYLRPYENCLWELPGLGIELKSVTMPHEHPAGGQ